MSLKWWWLALALTIPLIVLALIRLRVPAKKPFDLRQIVSHWLACPSYRREKRRAQLLKWAEVSALVVLCGSLVIIAARPQEQIKKVEDEQSRDIVLCVDVSASMEDFVPAAFATLRTVVAEHPTDRYSLVLFQNAPYVAIPLTGDVTAIDLIAKDLGEQFSETEFNAANTLGFKGGTGGGTDVGIGIASCFRRFDNIEQERSRHIILLSDMEHTTGPNPDGVASLLPKYGVKLYILAPRFALSRAEESTVTQITGATVGELLSSGSSNPELKGIFTSILNTRTSEVYVLADAPYVWWLIALIALSAWFAIVMARWRRS